MSVKTVAACGTVLVVVVSWLLSGQHRGAPLVAQSSAQEAVEVQATPTLVQRTPSSSQPIQAPEPGFKDPGGGPPVIEQLSVDKTEVCRGEDNFATVTAHTLDGADYYLRIGMTDPDTGRFLQGTRIPFHLDRQPSHPIRVSVEGRRRATIAQLPEIHVKDCDTPRRVSIATTRNFDASDRVRFDASVVENPRPGSLDNAPFRAASYDWDFGDGQTQTTNSPQTSHSYEARSQASVVSVYLVRVTLKERGDRAITGAVTVPLTNLGFVPLTHENTVLVRAGVIRKEGSDEPEKIWIYHGYSQAVSFDKVEFVEQAEGANAQPTRRELSPRAVLGLSTLAPGESKELPPLDASLTRPGRATTLELTGHTEDGKAVVGTIALSGSPPEETARSERPAEQVSATQ